MPKCKDYTGQICGCWKVLERDYFPKSKSHETFWKAECLNCGNISSVRKTDLDRKPLYCNFCKGDNPNVYKSYKIGDKYGFLTIIGRSSSKSGHTYVQCQCDCGNIVEVRLEHLKGQGHSRTISCGCYSKSSGELKIEQLLIDNKINFKEQYSIPDFNAGARFDFAVFDNNNILAYLIEYDGEQHFKPVENWGGEEAFKIQQQRDNKKNQYCQEHNIILIRIPYWDYDKIDMEYINNLYRLSE